MNKKEMETLKKGAEHYIKQGDFERGASFYRQAGMKGKERETLAIGAEHYIGEGDFERGASFYRQAGMKERRNGALEKGAKNSQKKKGSSLDKVVNLAVISLAFFCSFVYLSANITGNTILSTSFKLSNIVGAGLFIVGVVASFIYFERRK